MAIKRKLCEEEIGCEMDKKRTRKEDRLSSLPPDLQLRILSCLDAKDAAKISMLSKTSVSLWTWIPLLKFNFSAYNNLRVFDKFVNRVLRLRGRSATLDRLTFTRVGICSAKTLNNVFKYALSHGVKQLEVYIQNTRNRTWPICLHASFDSLTSLTLVSQWIITCPFLGPRSGSFKNLTALHLEGAYITHLEPFSGFPVLERLTLHNCDINTEDKTLSVDARNLSDLTISCYPGQSFNYCKLTTPRLRFFEYEGSDFPQFQTHHEGLPALDTMVIGYDGVCYRLQEKKSFDDLLSLFCALHDVKSLTLFWPIVDMLTLFQHQLVKRSSPFRKLKCVKLDFTYPKYQNSFDRPWSLEPLGMPSDVKYYFLQNSPDAKVTMIYPE